MKKSLLLGVVLMGIGIGAYAKDTMKCPMGRDMGSMKDQMVESRVASLKKELGLSAEQETKVKAALETEMEQKSVQMKEAQEKMKALHETTDAQLKAILTPEQQTKLDALKKKGDACCGMPAQKGVQCPMKGKDGHAHSMEEGSKK